MIRNIVPFKLQQTDVDKYYFRVKYEGKYIAGVKDQSAVLDFHC